MKLKTVWLRTYGYLIWLGGAIACFYFLSDPVFTWQKTTIYLGITYFSFIGSEILGVRRYYRGKKRGEAVTEPVAETPLALAVLLMLWPIGIVLMYLIWLMDHGWTKEKQPEQLQLF